MAALRELPRPGAVVVSFWGWLVGSLLVAGTVAVASTKLEVMKAELVRLAAERDPAATEATIDRVATASVLVVVGTGAVLGLLGLLLAGPLRAGRGWARAGLTLTALLALGYAVLAGTAVTPAMLDGLHVAVRGGLLLYAVVVIAAAVCMFLSGTRSWFRRPRGR